MTPQDVKKLTEWHHIGCCSSAVTLYLTTDEPSELFSKFRKQLKEGAPSVDLKTKTSDDNQMPGFKIGSNIWYRSIPTGKMLSPFLMALSGDMSETVPFSKDLLDEVNHIDLPTPITVYIAPECPFCPSVVTRLLRLAMLNERIGLEIIDGSVFMEKASADNIRSAPTVLLDGQFRWTGSFDMEEFVTVMRRRDPGDVSQEALIGLVEAGNANELANMMMQNGKLFPAFLDLLTHEKWPVRLGAMVVFETIADQDEPLAAQFTELLWKKFQTADETIQGDILYSLGVSKDLRIIPRLERVVRGAYEAPVKEAAQDAIDHIQST